MRVKYITIEREYGSGGTKIGQLLSQRTGVPCYGREILEQTSRKLGISVEQIESYEESVTGSFLYSLYMLSQMSSSNPSMVSRESYIFAEEQNVIHRLAADGSAIFLGHCADEALKDRNEVIRVFIHGAPEAKRKRIMEDYGIAPQNVDATMHKFDRKRSNYYSVNTGRKWDDLSGYDIVLDSSTLGLKGCVDVLEGLFRKN